MDSRPVSEYGVTFLRGNDEEKAGTTTRRLVRREP